MKNILFILFVLSGLWGCQEDDVVFDVSVPKENISFKPMPGGAVMYYSLPENSGIFSIQARYADVQGKEVVCGGSYLSDSVVLVGFNEARTDIPVFVSFRDRADHASGEMEMTFSTEDSAPVSFFDQLQVLPHWDGFAVLYDAPQNATGIAHVFYLGKDPKTNEPDTLLISSFNIAPGGDTIFFAKQQDVGNTTTVVVRTEDFRGYRVKQKVWEGIESYSSQKLEPADFEFIDPEGYSYENDTYMTGIQYLFDGDLKGLRTKTAGETAGKYFTFLTKDEGIGAPFIIDLKEAKVPASLRFYGILGGAQMWPVAPPSYGADPVMGPVWYASYQTKLPNEVTVYGSDDKENENSWEKIGHFYESPTALAENRWAERAYEWNYIDALEEFKAAEPCYMTIEFPAWTKPCRYVKFVVNSTFKEAGSPDLNLNPGHRFTMEELEVYTKKD